MSISQWITQSAHLAAHCGPIHTWDSQARHLQKKSIHSQFLVMFSCCAKQASQPTWMTHCFTCNTVADIISRWIKHQILIKMLKLEQCYTNLVSFLPILGLYLFHYSKTAHFVKCYHGQDNTHSLHGGPSSFSNIMGFGSNHKAEWHIHASVI